jgi:nitrogen fixation protein NifU and related proteins
MSVTGVHRVTVRKESPLCGDVIDLTVGIDGDVVRGASHHAQACSLVRASAEILEREVEGLTFEGAAVLATRVAGAMRGERPLPDRFDAVAPVLLMPSRRKCVLLPWDALLAAIDQGWH